MGLMGLVMTFYGGILGILAGLTRSTAHPSGAANLHMLVRQTFRRALVKMNQPS